MIASITFTIEDADGDKGYIRLWSPEDDAETIGSISAQCELIWDAIRPLVNGILVKIAVNFSVDIVGFANNTFTAISDVEEKAQIVLRTCAGNYLVRFNLPTVKESIFTDFGAGKTLDRTQTDVSIFDYMVTNDTVDGGGNLSDERGNVTCELLLGEQAFGKG
jgi:hypothetical protein